LSVENFHIWKIEVQMHEATHLCLFYPFTYLILLKCFFFYNLFQSYKIKNAFFFFLHLTLAKNESFLTVEKESYKTQAQSKLIIIDNKVKL
jgi:hypothetical protein